MTGAIPLLPQYFHIVDKAEAKVKIKIMYIEITSPLMYVVQRTHEYPVIIRRRNVET
jgi:hypothetical protein